ncbi:coth protein-domain-containing protein [Fennellomyces sp. T-0311]|nr:coth protein-domain-containing protein [Fennellomyces sp. T-0311]
MAVFVDDQMHLLKHHVSRSHLLHCGNAPLAKDSYYYAHVHEANVIDREPFVRYPDREPTVLKGHKATTHDFYNRTQNSWPVTPLPQLYKPLSVIRRIPTGPHVGDEIATVHIVADQGEIDMMHKNNMDKIKVKAKMFYISTNEVQEFDHVTFRVAGRSTRLMPKLSYDLKIREKEKQTLYGFRRLKLRSLYNDPSYIRENMAYRTLHSVGLPTSSFSYVRVFINNQAIGLFGLVESYSDPWIRTEFGYGKSWYRQGILYQAKASDTMQHRTPYISDLRYHGNLEGEIEKHYEQGQYKIKADPSLVEPSYTPLVQLTKFIADAPPQGGPCAVAAWKRRFNMESVLRSLAVEVMAGFTDGYITMANNYLLYQTGPFSTQFIFIPSDLDSTFGQSVVKFSDMLSGDYKTYPGYRDREFMQKVLYVPQFKSRFERLLKDMATKLFTSDLMGRTADDVVAMISEDVAWDLSLPRVHPGPFLLCHSLKLRSGEGDDEFDAKLSGNFPTDFNMILDWCDRLENQNVSFANAVEGDTGYISLLGVKEYIRKSSEAVQGFYNL